MKNEILDKLKNYSQSYDGTYAVMIPLVEIDGELHVIFEERSHKLKFQPGEICFPGGKIEEGETPRDAAIREFMEELYPEKLAAMSLGNVDKSNCSNALSSESSEVFDEFLNILCPLSPLPGPTGAYVYPFVCLVKQFNGSFSSDEVERIITYPISYFIEHTPSHYPMERKVIPPADFPIEKVTGGKSTYNWHAQKYDMWIYEDTSPVIWGFTGRLLHAFIEIIKA
jgi:hypothetical protein